MKKTEIEPGKVVAKRNSYGGPTPFVFLSAGLYTVSYGNSRAEAGGHDPKRPARHAYGGGGTGYLAAHADGYSKVSAEERLAYLRKIDPAAAIGRWLAGKGEAPGISVGLVYSLGQFGGDYDAELAAYEQHQEARLKAREARDDAARQASQRADGAVEALAHAVAELGRPGLFQGLYAALIPHTTAYSVRMTVEDAEALAGLLGTLYENPYG